MATATYVQMGDSVDYTPGADVAAGDVVVQADLLGVAKLDIKSGKLGALAVSGVFDFPKEVGQGTAIAAGTKVYWNAGDKWATFDDESGTHKFIGKTVLAVGDNDEKVRVRVSQ